MGGEGAHFCSFRGQQNGTCLSRSLLLRMTDNVCRLLPLRFWGNGGLDGESQCSKASRLFSGNPKPDSLFFSPAKRRVNSNSMCLVSESLGSKHCTVSILAAAAIPFWGWGCCYRHYCCPDGNFKGATQAFLILNVSLFNAKADDDISVPSAICPLRRWRLCGCFPFFNFFWKIYTCV